MYVCISNFNEICCKVIVKFNSHDETGKLVWHDKGSGASFDFSCYSPPSGQIRIGKTTYYSIGHFGVSHGVIWSGHESSQRKPRVFTVSVSGESSANVFKKPTGFSRIWRDKDSGAWWDGSFWEVKCPNGYGSLSDLCQRGHSSPSTNSVWCIRETYLERDYHNQWIWDDKGSGAGKDVDINGGQTDMTKELISATATRGTKKPLRKISSEYLELVLNW